MSNDKKHSAFTVHNADGSWVARVVRRKASKGSVVERELAGFDSQEAAQEWGPFVYRAIQDVIYP